MRSPHTHHSLRDVILVLGLALSACAPAGPRAVRYGADACGYCRMTITDRRFGAQVVTARGKLDAFDAVECLADYVNATPDGTAPAAQPRAWVADFQRPGAWIRIDSARFVRLARAGSPMGGGLAALRADASTTGVAIDGHAMPWDEVLAARRSARGPALREHAAEAPQHEVQRAARNAAGAAHAD